MEFSAWIINWSCNIEFLFHSVLDKNNRYNRLISFLFLVVVVETVFTVETIDTTISLNESLLTGVEWVAVTACIHSNFLFSRTCFECCTTADTCDFATIILWMNVFFHFLISFRLGQSVVLRKLACRYYHNKLI